MKLYTDFSRNRCVSREIRGNVSLLHGWLRERDTTSFAAGRKTRPRLPSLENTQGFTLFETLVILAILTMLAGLSANYIQLGDGNRQLRLITDNLSNDLMRARSEAYLRNTSISLRFSRHFYISETLGIKRQMPGGVTILLPVQTQHIIRFSPFELNPGNSIRLHAGPHAYEVRVEPLTGRIHVLPSD